MPVKKNESNDEKGSLPKLSGVEKELSHLVREIRIFIINCFHWLLHKFDFRKFEKQKKVSFFTNIAIGFIVAILLLLLGPTQLVENNINTALDYFIDFDMRQSLKSPAKLNKQWFIDIDEKTYEKWDKPNATPQGELARIIKVAYQERAKVILLNIFLEQADYDNNGFKQLRDILNTICRDKASHTKVILCIQKDREGQIQKNLFDDLVRNNPDKFYYAFSYVPSSSMDRVVRHWQLYDTFKGAESSTPEILWGAPFLAAILQADKEDVLTELKIKLNKELIKQKGKVVAKDIGVIPVGDNSKLKLSTLKFDPYLQRIRFRLIPQGTLKELKDGNIPLISAADIDKYDSGNLKIKDENEALFKNKIVIIGNSNSNAKDIHATPVGDMPGMYIIGNAIDTILYNRQINSIEKWETILWGGIGIIVGAYFFLYFTSSRKISICSSIALVILGIFSAYYFMMKGGFFGFLLPTIWIGFFQLITDGVRWCVERTEKKINPASKLEGK